MGESPVLEWMGTGVESGGTYVGGRDDVLAVLNKRRVDLLLVENGFSQPGKYCPACNTLEFAENTCPACAGEVEMIGDVVEEAKELAVRQDAVVRTVPLGHPAIAKAGHIAARLRY